MTAFTCRVALAAAVFGLFGAAPALAQENLDQGKTAAQLYASDCAICHKTPHGLAQAASNFSLEGFLREHYTASREAAAAIAAYLVTAGKGPPPKETKGKRSAKGGEKSAKPNAAKDSTAKDTKDKAEGAKEAKPSEAKPSEAKPSEAKPSETKPGAKPKAAASGEAKSEKPAAKPEAKTEAKPDAKLDAKPDAKPESEKKSD